MESNKKIIIIEDTYLAKSRLKKDITNLLINAGLIDVELIFKDSISDLESETAAILQGNYSLVFMDGNIRGGKTTDIVKSLIQQRVETPIVSISGGTVLKELGLYNLGKSYTQKDLLYTLESISNPGSELREKRKMLIDSNTGQQDEPTDESKSRRKRLIK